MKHRRFALLAAVVVLTASCGSARGRTHAADSPATTSTEPATAPTTPTTAQPTPSTTPLACGTMTPANPPKGSTITVTASLGPVTATLTGTSTSEPGGPALSSPTLRVTEQGQTLLSRPVKPPPGAVAVLPLNVGPDAGATPDAQVVQPLCLARFSGDNRPAVILGFYTGGAHCCTVLRALSLSNGRSAAFVDDNVGNPYASLATDGDHALIVTADDAFNYTFSDYAHSGAPIEVLELVNGQFVNTTSHHPQLAAKDAPRWLGWFNNDPADGLGVLAAWVADECVAGRSGPAWATVDQFLQQGKLTGGPFSPGGSAFVRDLHLFLAREGYCPAEI